MWNRHISRRFDQLLPATRDPLCSFLPPQRDALLFPLSSPPLVIFYAAVRVTFTQVCSSPWSVARTELARGWREEKKRRRRGKERKREEGRKKEEAQSYQSCVDWCFEERDWFSANELVEHLSRFLKNDKGDFSAGRAQASDYFTRFGRVFLGPELGRRAIRRGSSSGDDPSTITLRLCLSFSLCRGRKFTLLSRD